MADSPITRANCTRGFTLVELLVVIAILSVLIGLTLPGLSGARESSRRLSCINNMKQIGLAAKNYYGAHNSFPVGLESRQWAQAPTNPWTFYRWSSLAHLTPYLEQSNAYKALDLTLPLYGTNFNITPDNVKGVALLVPLFLCPSDEGQPVSPQFGPSNYVACAGTGINGGSPLATDGTFFVNSHIRETQIVDGLSHTALFSESILGTLDGTPSKNDPQVDYKFTLTTPLTTSSCASTQQWNVSDGRNFAWVSGEFRCCLYNHYFLPNQGTPDCIASGLGGGVQTQFMAYGWKAAHSRHPGGVNLLLADGSVQTVSDDIDITIWKAYATRAGHD